jgi:hypothetical protein
MATPNSASGLFNWSVGNMQAGGFNQPGGFNQAGGFNQGFGQQGYGQNPYLQSVNQGVGNQLDALTKIYGFNTQGNMNYLNNLVADRGNILNNLGMFERQQLGGQQALDQIGLSKQFDKDISQEQQWTQRQANKINQAIAEGKFGSDERIAGVYDTGQTARANIATEVPKLAEQNKMSRFNAILPTLLEMANRFAPQNGGGAGQETPVPGFGGFDTDALVNQANRGAYQALGGGLKNDVAGMGGRGFTSANSNAVKALDNQRRIGLANQLATNAAQVPLGVAQTVGPLQLQAAALREGGRAARSREGISREQNQLGYLASLLGTLGGFG